jgi:hypothetical protein
MVKKRWSELSPRTRRLVIVGATGDGLLKLAALRDLRRRPAAQVRGRKWVWAVALAVVNSAGVLPVTYFRYGRRSG